MTFGEKIQEKLAEWRPAGGTRAKLTIADDKIGWTTTLTAERNDELGCLVWELNWLRTAATGSESDLKAWATQVAGRITGLVEPLKVVEVDPSRNEAILRSAKVTQRAAVVLYYEALLQGTGNVTLRRYQAHQDNSQRQQVAFALTHETLARVVDELVAA